MSHPDYKNIGSPSIRLIEECGELIKAVCKAERFGWNNWHPDNPQQTNFDDVIVEYSDVKEAMESLLTTIGPIGKSDKPVCGTCGGTKKVLCRSYYEGPPYKKIMGDCPDCSGGEG